MERILLGETDIEVSRVGLGTWAMGGVMWQNEPDEDAAVKTVRQAIDIGITTIDTAPDYGLGNSEAYIGKALSQAGIARDQVQLLGKPGVNWNKDKELFRDMRPDKVETELDNTLRRLNTDYLDLYQIHWPDHEAGMEQMGEVMNKLYEKGKIRAVGVSNFTPDEMEELRRYVPLHTTQNQYNMFQRELKPWFEYAERNHIAGITWGTFAHSLLTGKVDAQSTFTDEDIRASLPLYQNNSRNYYLAAVRELQEFAHERNKTIAQLAARWTLENPGISMCLWGARTPEQIKEAEGVDGWILDQEEMEHIEDILAKHVPSLQDNQLNIYAPPERSDV